MRTRRVRDRRIRLPRHGVALIGAVKKDATEARRSKAAVCEDEHAVHMVIEWLEVAGSGLRALSTHLPACHCFSRSGSPQPAAKKNPVVHWENGV
jgi:hypothetical protein|tara:strand:+ start:893 stop:1177 length:285 start_codon:yes stop_codon:yes gene_type:complete